ncbi:MULTISPECIES: acyl-CoA carboxylase subunit epsilon [unclassified Streptomyces]|uniref:acyl-CoA carboxylase subunit epsilon n=1 Tax=unclassified Streptomyces TaxID=2593676 RepID=UPI003646E5F8
MTTGTTMETPETPLLSFVRGAPTDEEVAALLAVVHGRASRTDPETPEPANTGPRWAQTRTYRVPRAWTSR